MENMKKIYTKEDANFFIENGYGVYVVENLEYYRDIDPKEIANKLIETGWGDYVAENLEKFNLNSQEKENILTMVKIYDKSKL